MKKEQILKHESYFTHRHGQCSLTEDDILFYKWWGFSFGVMGGIAITLIVITLLK